MPSTSTGSPRPTSEPEVQDSLLGPAGPNHHLSQGRNTSLELFYEERCLDPELKSCELQRPKGNPHKARSRDTQGREAEEKVGFIPSSADSSPGGQGCGSCGGPCASPGSCRSCLCSVLTCGLYRVFWTTVLAPCLTPNPRGSLPEDSQGKLHLQSLQGHPGTSDTQTRKESEGRGSDWSEDVYIKGVKVDIPRMEEEEFVSPRPRLHHGSEGGGWYSRPSYSWDEEDLANMNVGDVDSLITQKLLELYTEYQIEELARCTSDSVFLNRTSRISQLISNLAEEHQLDEQDAECRLVKGIIRISTRASKKRPLHKRSHRRQSDSGNETMSNYQTSTISNNNDYNIQISKETDSDMNARNMRMNSEAESSEHQISVCGIPLHRTSVRT
ncbi:keratinocyte differentiation factor 1 isoform X2 [Esox lucius]|uniref:keratinocyte differentiation factor 1 isoform X2 n=1 Tax=Esox lucius TaxID=8010 RepID=UPI001476C1DF|nr:keratinocyte differentiation factor 1 isoform X2 [Esox lucius]